MNILLILAIFWPALAGLVITLSLVVGEISALLEQVKRIFGL